MGNTKINWCDKVWNPVIGCSPAGIACEHCYASKMATRLAGNPKTPRYKGIAINGKWTGRIHFVEETLLLPLEWKKPCRIFVNSMGDLFHPAVPAAYIEKVLNIVNRAPNHIFIVLTKRPAGMMEYMLTISNYARLQNLWLGVSVWDQKSYDRSIIPLMMTPARKRVISYEPALGSIDLRGFSTAYRYRTDPLVDWIIAGRETGINARPADLSWFRGMRDQCSAAEIPFFYKNGLLDGKAYRGTPNE